MRLIFSNIFGLNNFKIVKVLSILSLFLGMLIIIFFYNLSSNLQSYYLEFKNQYSKDKHIWL